MRSWLRTIATRLRARPRRGIREPEFVTVRAGDLHYVVPAADRGPGQALALGAETPELRVLPRALEVLAEHADTREGTVFVDVGANIGTTVLPALAAHGFATAIAVEPDPANVSLLAANAALNRLAAHVEIVAAAASASSGKASFRRGKVTPSGRRTGAGRLATEDHHADLIDVEVVTVDEVIEARGIAPADVGLLWLDVQGNEGHVLRGATKLLVAGCPVVFAARPRKLAKAGALEPLVEAIARHYTTIVDLRAPEGSSTWRPEPAPAEQIAEVLARRPTTDLLAFREPRGSR